MISLEEFKKASKDIIEELKLSEEKIIKLREDQDKMAEILFNLWLDEIHKNNV